jgi:hypothetical protein
MKQPRESRGTPALVCRRCGYVFPPPAPKRCPNCERSSWHKPAHLLSTREAAGLDNQGFDREGRYRALAVRSADADRRARRQAKVQQSLSDLLGETGDRE